jgi:5'-nucleotidase
MRPSASHLSVVALLCVMPAAYPGGGEPPASLRSAVTISIVGTTDLHGALFAANDRGGLALLAGFVNNLRAARAADGGAVLLLDAGDMFLDGMESNLTEGAVVVDAYNAMRYTAAAIGNHEFEFGPVDEPGARQPRGGDPRGALKARAAQARYPFLAANLIDVATNRAVDWPNVRPSFVMEAAGVRVGIIGAMTIDALRSTLAVNVQGLRVAPLAATLAGEAARLRENGAEVVVVTAHAGGFCRDFASPTDLSSCDPNSEIFALAKDLPPGLVDVIVAGHTHDAVAHEVAGVAIIQGYPRGAAFARADLVFDREIRRVVKTTLFAPRAVCARPDPKTLRCDAPSESRGAAEYEGREVVPDDRVIEAMAPALARVRQIQATPMGIFVDTPIRRTGEPEVPLANLLADTLRSALFADVALHGSVRGGMRADIPDGPLTFGRLYESFPFDNRVARVTLTGGELRRVLADEIRRRRRRGTLAISGVAVKSRCSVDGMAIELLRPESGPVGSAERLVVVAMDSLLSGLVETIGAVSSVGVTPDSPVLREVIEDSLRRRSGRLVAEQLVDPRQPRWDVPDAVLSGCEGN